MALARSARRAFPRAVEPLGPHAEQPPRPPTVLVAGEADAARAAITRRLEAAGMRIAEANTAGEVLARIDHDVDLVLLNGLPQSETVAILDRLRTSHPHVRCIVAGGQPTVANAVNAMRLGAFDYVTKPLDDDDVARAIEMVLEPGRLRQDTDGEPAAARQEYAFESIIGTSRAMCNVRALLKRISRSRASIVLLTGETGTGKDLAARVIHHNSDRARHPYVNITCSAIPEALLESELFGHERGAFTDACQSKRGLLEIADGGTVFLDEIGEIAPALQVKLLRFLEERTFKHVGGLQDITVDARVVAASNQDLLGAVSAGRFRADLYYRLQLVPVHLPPLRERREDIPLLAFHFTDQLNHELEMNVRGITPDAMQMLAAAGWPGNVRELRNTIERAMLLTDREWVDREDVTLLSAGDRPAATFALPPDGIDLEQVERQFILQALDRAGGNRTHAAALLGINRDQVRYRVRKFRLPRAPGRRRSPAP